MTYCLKTLRSRGCLGTARALVRITRPLPTYGALDQLEHILEGLFGHFLVDSFIPLLLVAVYGFDLNIENSSKWELQ